MADLKGGKPTQFDTNNDCFMDLESGRSDAIVVDENAARYYMKQQDKVFKYVVLDEKISEQRNMRLVCVRMIRNYARRSTRQCRN